MAKWATFKCEYCGEEFRTNNYNANSSQHFCCREHYLAYKKEFGKMNTPNCTCEQCGKPIYKSACSLKTNKHTFCSRQCQNTFQAHERSKKHSDLNATCSYCGKAFHRSKEHLSANQNFCSMECRKKYRESQRVKKVCKTCGKEFYVIKSRAKKASFCSVNCHDEYQRRFFITAKCAYCGKEITVDKTTQLYSKTGNYFCSNACVGKFFSGENSPTYKGTASVVNILRGYFQTYQRQDAFKRGKGKCVLCGARAEHVHHVYPIFRMIDDFCIKHPDIDITQDCYYVASLIIKESKEFKDPNNLIPLCKKCHYKQHKTNYKGNDSKEKRREINSRGTHKRITESSGR